MLSESNSGRSLRSIGLVVFQQAQVQGKESGKGLAVSRKTRYVIGTIKRCISIICEEDAFKVDAGIMAANNLGMEHICPYIRKAEEAVQHSHDI